MVYFAVLFAAVPAAILLIIALVARRRAKQPVGLVIPEYAPLPQATVLYDAVMADADARALPAALVDLAIRRKIRLLSEPAAATKKASREPLSIELVEGAQFTPQERRVLAVFLGEESAERSVRRLSTDRGATGRRASALLKDTVGELADAGIVVPRSIRWPHNVCRVFGLIGAVATVLVAGLCGAMWVEDRTAAAGVVVAALSFVITIVAMIVCPTPWRRFLAPSLPIRRHLAGMKEYIRLAETDRLRVLQSPQGAVRVPAGSGLERIHVYERLLPYAILFGQEKQWAEVLRSEASSLDADALEVAFAAGEVVVLAIHLAEAAVTIVDAVSTVGQVVDAGGSVLEGIGALLDV